MEIGQKIRKLREERKMSQDELAKIIGYTSRSSINKIEKDGRGIPSDKIILIADVFGVSPAYLMGWQENKSSVKIPVLGTVAAGIPIEAITEINSFEEISAELASKGEYYALKVKGDSMYPRIHHGDTIIFRKQADVENGEIAIVSVNGGEATCKKLMKSKHGITLIAFNQSVYEPTFYSNKEIEELPITIYGLVTEVRAHL